MYLRSALRIFKRQRFHVAINIFGLAIGLAASMLILMWVRFEYSYNDFAASRDDIYQVKINFRYNGTISTEEGLCLPAYEAIPAAESRIRQICFTSNTFGHSLKSRQVITNKEVLAVSEEFLAMFGIPILKGSIHSLDDPYSIMLNESTAKELFGDKDPIGQVVTYDNLRELKVSGVFKDVPFNSTFWFHALVSVRQDREWLEADKDKWDSFYPKMYVTLVGDADVDEVNDDIRDVVSRHMNDGSKPTLFLHAMNRWYLYDSFTDGKESGGRIEFVQLFMVIGILILLIACINYINLSTARSQFRAKEVGIRKSIGSSRLQLIRQFLGESFIVTLVAFMIAIVIVQLSIPQFNSVVHARLTLDYTSPQYLGLAMAVLVITAIASGCYPAFYFSSFRPVQVLRGNPYIGKETILPRNALVSAQYIIAIFLLIGVTIVYQQINHLHRRQLGYSQENLICYAVNTQMDRNYGAIKNELLSTGVVDAVSIANEGIDVDYFFDYVEWNGKITSGPVQFSRISTDHDFAKTHDITIVAGRDFSPTDAADTTKVLVNETAVKLMNMKDPIGQKIRVRGNQLTIIGVIQDVVRSTFHPVNPCFVGLFGDGNNHMSIRLSETNDIAASIAKINDVFKRLDPDNIDEPEFVSDRFEYGFNSINFVGQLAGTLALLAVFLTCLGVLGLASYMAEQRAKELAIRKVLGAGAERLLWLMSGYFVRMIVIAAIISGPVSWWAADQYLETYVYRMDVPLWVIPVTVTGLLIFTMMIVAAQVSRAVNTNPVVSLKAE